MIASNLAVFARGGIDVYQDDDLWTHLCDAGRCQVVTCLGYESIRVAVGSTLKWASSDA